MEEWVGRQWHQWISRAARQDHPQAVVTLASMQRPLTLMLHAGGAATARVTAAGAVAVGGPRGWLQRLAGGGSDAPLGQWDADVLALPPQIALFADATLNRDLYLWLAALATQLQATGHWVADNQRAAQAALATWPGLRARHCLGTVREHTRRHASRQESVRKTRKAAATGGDLWQGGAPPTERPRNTSPRRWPGEYLHPHSATHHPKT